MSAIDVNYINSLDASIIQQNQIGNRLAVDNLLGQRNQYFLSLGISPNSYQIGCFMNSQPVYQQQVQQLNTSNQQLLYNNQNTYNNHSSMGTRFNKKEVVDKDNHLTSKTPRTDLNKLSVEDVSSEYEYVLAIGVDQVLSNTTSDNHRRCSVSFKGTYLKDQYIFDIHNFKVSDELLCEELLYIDRYNSIIDGQKAPIYQVQLNKHFLLIGDMSTEVTNLLNSNNQGIVSNMGKFLCDEIINHTEHYSMDKLSFNYKSLNNLIDIINGLINGSELISDQKRCLKDALNHYNSIVSSLVKEKYDDNILKVSIPTTNIISYHDVLYKDIVKRSNKVLLVDEYSHEPLFNMLNDIKANILYITFNSNLNNSLKYRVYVRKENIVLCKCS